MRCTLLQPARALLSNDVLRKADTGLVGIGAIGGAFGSTAGNSKVQPLKGPEIQPFLNDFAAL